jgi:hypothetical protein
MVLAFAVVPAVLDIPLPSSPVAAGNDNENATHGEQTSQDAGRQQGRPQ